jgi:hypothetical protein
LRDRFATWNIAVSWCVYTGAGAGCILFGVLQILGWGLTPHPLPQPEAIAGAGFACLTGGRVLDLVKGLDSSKV